MGIPGLDPEGSAVGTHDAAQAPPLRGVQLPVEVEHLRGRAPNSRSHREGSLEAGEADATVTPALFPLVLPAYIRRRMKSGICIDYAKLVRPPYCGLYVRFLPLAEA